MKSQFPTIINDLSPLTVGASVIVLIGGYLTHELLHVIPLAIAGADYEVEFAPGDEPLWWNLTVGRAFEFETETHPAVGLISVLAPGVLTIPGLVLWARFLHSDYVSASLVLVVATWIIVFLPSLADWIEARRQWRLLRGAAGQ